MKNSVLRNLATIINAGEDDLPEWIDEIAERAAKRIEAGPSDWKAEYIAAAIRDIILRLDKIEREEDTHGSAV